MVAALADAVMYKKMLGQTGERLQASVAGGEGSTKEEAGKRRGTIGEARERTHPRHLSGQRG